MLIHFLHTHYYSIFNISSKFIDEVNETNNVIALYPSQIERKCVCLTVDGKTYFCPLPYRIYGD